METIVKLERPERQLELFGPTDSYLRYLRQALSVRLTPRNDSIRVVGAKENVHRAVAVLKRMQTHLERHDILTQDIIEDLVRGHTHLNGENSGKGLIVYSHAKMVYPSTEGQRYYLETMQANDITFCVGPAGSGKTYLAVAVAVSMLKQKIIRRIVLARPAVEAGELIGQAHDRFDRIDRG